MRRLLELGGVAASSRMTVVAGARMHHLEAGRGAAVVLLHGAGGGGANWYRVMASLAAESRILAPDLPGFGLSPSGLLAAPLGVHGAEIVRSWLDGVGVEQCDLVGTSFGGLIALRLALAEPTRVRRLVLMDAVGLGRELPWQVCLAGIRPLGRLLTLPTREGSRWLLRGLLTGGDRRLDAAHEAALANYLWHVSAADDGTLARALRMFVSGVRQREVVADAELSAIRQPVLVLWGERDGFVPLRHGARAAAVIPRAVLNVVRGAGHSPNWEDPDAVLPPLHAFLAA